MLVCAGPGYELEVVGPDCQVIGCQRGRPQEDQGPTHRFEVGPKETLFPHFKKAQVWSEALRAARARAETAQEAVPQALRTQEQRLVALIDRIDRIDETLRCPTRRPDRDRE